MRRRNFKCLIGIDEAGRGPLAGPVAVAAVAVPMKMSRLNLGKLRDSKHLAPARREVWFAWLKQKQDRGELKFAVSLVGEKIIDRLGIVAAVKIGLRRCLARLKLNLDACRILLDGGLRAPKQYRDQRTVIRGDSTVPIIMLASIAAKVRRDRRLVRLARRYPGYDFEIHKGYGTKKHYAALRRRGLSPLHRRSFLKNLNKKRRGFGKSRRLGSSTFRQDRRTRRF